MQKSGTRLYKVWSEMKRRCNNKNDNVYKYYGGRGIKYCPEWEKFEIFEKWALANGYKELHRGLCTLDRIDHEGDYRPENCRWISINAQQRNKRNSFMICIDGKTMTASEWSEVSGVSSGTIVARIKKYGYTEKEAVFTPPRFPVKNGLVYNGKMLSIMEWSRRTGINPKTIHMRLSRGWSIEKTLTTPTITHSAKKYCRGGG